MPAVALTIAGSDPSGGAGVQADLKTFHQFGVYGEAAITLVTVQNTHSVSRVETLAADLVRQQIDAVIDDIPPNAAKTGALGTLRILDVVAELAKTFTFPLVVDPVFLSKDGARLISSDGQQALKEKLLPHAFLVTPNIPEAESLAGMTIRSEDDRIEAARRLLDFGCQAVLIKGGHGVGEPTDILLHSTGVKRFSGVRVNTQHTHGTGCTFSAAITAGLALGHDLETAIHRAKFYIQSAIENAPKLGRGHGPVNHMVDIPPVH